MYSKAFKENWYTFKVDNYANIVLLRSEKGLF